MKQALFRKHGLIPAVSLFCTLITLFLIAKNPEMRWSEQIFRTGEDLYMDFMNHVTYCRVPASTYEVSHHACFPALAYVFYYMAGQMIPVDQLTLWDASKTGPLAILIYTVYAVVVFTWIYEMMRRFLKDTNFFFAAMLAVSFLLSYPYLTGNLERGNASALVLAMLLTALYLKDEESKAGKEAALILIAVSAGFKIYPAVFGLLYLKEKRYKEAIRLVIYGLIFFFVPFLFFGGYQGFLLFIKNQMNVQSSESAEMSVYYLIQTVLRGITGSAVILRVLTYVLYFAVFSALLILFAKGQRKWIDVLILTAFMVLFPKWSGRYTMSYFLIPMLLFIRESREDNPGLTLLTDLGFALSISFLGYVPFRFVEGYYPCAVGCYLVTVTAVIMRCFEIKRSKKS